MGPSTGIAIFSRDSQEEISGLLCIGARCASGTLVPEPNNLPRSRFYSHTRWSGQCGGRTRRMRQSWREHLSIPWTSSTWWIDAWSRPVARRSGRQVGPNRIHRHRGADGGVTRGSPWRPSNTHASARTRCTIFLAILKWSLFHAFLAQYPQSRHDGTPWTRAGWQEEAFGRGHWVPKRFDPYHR